ncbi:transferase [Kitasatospora sp. NPDC127059]|uniref:transferase n=1 Tax=Kitasatospora sp. NPDC127059 TaxID=3347120 RepID=UPI003663C5A1
MSTRGRSAQGLWMSSGLRTLARVITVTALLAAYVALHLAITAVETRQDHDRFHDGAARATAFTALVNRYASGDPTARAEVGAARAWFEENAPPGRARATVAAATDLVGHRQGAAARERAGALAADVERDRATLDQDLRTQTQAMLWLAAVALALAGPSLRLRRRRRAATAEAVRTVGRFAERHPPWRRPLFLIASGLGYTLFVGGMFLVAKARRTDMDVPPVAVQLEMLPGGLVAIGVGFLILRYTRPRSTRNAVAALRADGRRPVLYLRSFADDRTAAQIDDGQELNIHSREEQLAAALRAFGPVIAVGRPGEPLPLLGAARFYLPLDDWKPTILRLMDLAQLIVLRVGVGEGLRWEIEQVIATQPARKLLLLTPGRVREAIDSLDGRLPVPLPLEGVATDTSWISAAVTFGPDWTPQVRAVRPVPDPEAPRGGLLRRVRTGLETIGEPSPARRTVRAMKAALAAVGVRGRMVVMRSDSNMLVTLGKGAVAIAVLVLLFRLLELAGR